MPIIIVPTALLMTNPILNLPSLKTAKKAEEFAKFRFKMFLSQWVQQLLVIRKYNKEMLLEKEKQMRAA